MSAKRKDVPILIDEPRMKLSRQDSERFCAAFAAALKSFGTTIQRVRRFASDRSMPTPSQSTLFEWKGGQVETIFVRHAQQVVRVLDALAEVNRDDDCRDVDEMAAILTSRDADELRLQTMLREAGLCNTGLRNIGKILHAVRDAGLLGSAAQLHYNSERRYTKWQTT